MWDSLFSVLKKGWPAFSGALITAIGWVAEHKADILPLVPPSIAPYLQIVGVIIAAVSHSPLPSKPDGK